MDGYRRDVNKIMLNLAGNCYETADNADFAALSQDDIEIVSPEDTSHFIEYKLLQGNHDINALVLSATPYCRQAAKPGPASDCSARRYGADRGVSGRDCLL